MRIGLAAVLVESLVSIADQGGPASFRGATNLTEPSLLVLDLIMVALFASLAGALATALGARGSGDRWPLAALAVLGAAVVIAGALAQLAHGTIWNSPLSDLVWWFDVLMLLETIAALAVAIVIGMPGCEIGVWTLLIARARGDHAPRGTVGCVVGLDLIDRWEAARRTPDPRNTGT